MPTAGVTVNEALLGDGAGAWAASAAVAKVAAMRAAQTTLFISILGCRSRSGRGRRLIRVSEMKGKWLR